MKGKSLTTNKHEWTQITEAEASGKLLRELVFIRVHSWLIAIDLHFHGIDNAALIPTVTALESRLNDSPVL